MVATDFWTWAGFLSVMLPVLVIFWTAGGDN
ncbi:hypothetical protein LMG19087_02143 [Ralstonia wenshanensis]|nr:hypothetical protein LMG19087_02143 [Ralstonia wenshanensis]